MNNLVWSLPDVAGKKFMQLVQHMGRWAVFSATSLVGILHIRRLLSKIAYDIYFIGFKSLNIIVLVAFLPAWSLACKATTR